MMKRWVGGFWNVPGARWENTEDEASPCPPDLPPWYTQGSNHHHHISLAWSHIIRKVPTLTQVVTITYRSGNVNVQKLCIVGWGLVSWFNIMVEVLRELKVIHEQALCINTEGLNQPSPNHHHRWSMMILIICKVHGPNRHHRQIITIHQTNDIGFIRADEGIRCAEFNRCTLWPFYEHFVPPL